MTSRNQKTERTETVKSKMPRWAKHRQEQASQQAEIVALQAQVQYWEQAYSRLLDEFVGACIEHEEAEATAGLAKLEAERCRRACEALAARVRQLTAEGVNPPSVGDDHDQPA